uniref:Uncharacterized protein n=1 Tax=Cajanus cajan TaxID=3821 RepID=A0A151RAW3_CAJCA|nr:hypothetical protein KK1_038976 [Cajanus cajan]
MHPNKSPGLDGLNSIFFQHFWSLSGKDIFTTCTQWMESGFFPHLLNNTNVGEVTLKIDINKAYECIDWGFLVAMMLQSISIYNMNVYLFPIFISKELQRMLNAFSWGVVNRDKKEIKWMSWEKLTMRKGLRGMRFCNFYGSNLAMQRKQGWKFLSNLDALVT